MLTRYLEELMFTLCGLNTEISDVKKLLQRQFVEDLANVIRRVVNINTSSKQPTIYQINHNLK